jgi:CDP-L-myo-inositol myo-inositolphosphotransferase
VSKGRSQTRQRVRLFAAVLGIALLAYLILRTGPESIAQHAKAVGWGLGLIIVLGGVSHVIKTWAWRLTFVSEIGCVSFARTFALRLASEAAGNFGLPGQVLGDTMRVSLLGSAVPVADSISSVTLDRALYAVTSAMVSVAGILVAVLLVSFSGALRLYALLFAAALAIFLAVTVMAVRKRWPVLSGAARAIGHLPWFKKWLDGKQSVVDSAEKNLLGFYHETPTVFWSSLVLNLASHGVAILEVYLLLRFMGARVAFLGAFVLEALTKLINVIGALNPGNIGTYEGGNMIVTRLFGITSAAGLTLALCRRARTLFWAAVGAVCLILISRATEQSKPEFKDSTEPPDKPQSQLNPSTNLSERGRRNAPAVIILADARQDASGFIPALARVGTLPVLLRAILAAQGLQASRIIVYVDSEARVLRDELRLTGRLSKFIEWREPGAGTNVSSLLREVAATSEHLLLLQGSRTYQPALLDSVSQWKEPTGALALTTGDELAGVYALSQAAALEFANDCNAEIGTLEGLHHWMKSRGYVATKPVPKNSWQDITTPVDRFAAERKLDRWLVKPTDGVFARMNRRVSIPISRQLIKFPITPNMVTIFTLAVSCASGIFFARGGYWNMLLGALLSLWASILDGCDGEVARLKLQSSDFGCWLETICDYLYYLLVFGGMTLGLAKTSGAHVYLFFGGVLFFGAGASFLVVGRLRHSLAGDRPEQFLTVWQAKTESRHTNPLLFLGRHTEFIIRRCFLPYALLFFAILNVANIAFIASAIGANLVWLIALYSHISFSGKRRLPASLPDDRISTHVTAKASL